MTFKKGQVANPKGRPVGTPNKVNLEFRDTVRKLLEDNAQNVSRWLSEVADGKPRVLNEKGEVLIPAKDGDPGKALDLMAKLAEYAAPKLSRSEVDAKVDAKMQVAWPLPTTELDK